MINTPAFNPDKKYVRVIETHANGLVEFEFAVGEPEVFVELVMPKTAFEAFCRDNQVETLGPAAPLAPDAAEAADADFHWSLHQATHQRFR